MAEDKKGFCETKQKIVDNIWNRIANIKWQIHHSYGQSYLDQDEINFQTKNLSILRRLRCVTPDEVGLIKHLLRTGRNNKKELDEYLYNAPRREAQKFIGKKNIRLMIFSRDKYCLCCGTDSKLTLDHIVPIARGGSNRIGNLQTLCSSCNSRKGARYIDYR